MQYRGRKDPLERVAQMISSPPEAMHQSRISLSAQLSIRLVRSMCNTHPTAYHIDAVLLAEKTM